MYSREHCDHKVKSAHQSLGETFVFNFWAHGNTHVLTLMGGFHFMNFPRLSKWVLRNWDNIFYGSVAHGVVSVWLYAPWQSDTKACEQNLCLQCLCVLVWFCVSLVDMSAWHARAKGWDCAVEVATLDSTGLGQVEQFRYLVWHRSGYLQFVEEQAVPRNHLTIKLFDVMLRLMTPDSTLRSRGRPERAPVHTPLHFTIPCAPRTLCICYTLREQNQQITGAHP